ncbi:MAG: flagellar protein FlgN [Candidatus Methylomirabilota bacterium]|nr:flagellar protein FlgN [Candidatus Methylomirabilis sp.]NJD69426.1 flagellar protein FlgN [candidate division NC10 bacterium]PWB43521.1 MAG: flagellar protein FlgN [candidate division NC10 bacterium]
MLLEDLAHVLEQETEKYETLLRLLRQERGLIVEGDLAALSELIKRKETLVLELKMIQEARAALVARASVEYGIPLVELTLYRLADLIPASQAPSYRRLLDRLTLVAGALAEENGWSAALLDRSLMYMKGSLSFLASAMTPVPLYQGDGSVAAQSPTLSVLNSQA